jgi:acetyltransferase-like isoleucine patch superfamily enzyme
MMSVRNRTRRIVGGVVQRAAQLIQDFGAIHPGSAGSEGFGHLGEGCVISFPRSSLFGQAGIHIGAGTLIAPYASLSAGYPFDDVQNPRLVIGERCVIGYRSGITAHESIVIGDDVYFGQDVFITDSNHGTDDLDKPIGHQFGPCLPVRIGDGSWLGHGCVVLPGVTIGRNAVVAAGAVVREDVPDHCVAAGVPARIVKRLHGDD